MIGSRVRLVLVVIVTVLVGGAFARGLYRGDTPVAQAQPGRILFVHSNQNVAAAQRFSDLLTQNGWTVDLIVHNQLSGADLSIYHAIILAEDTASGTNWRGGGGERFAILNARRPVIGLHSGGYAFFGALGLNIGYPNGNTVTTSATVTAVDPQSSLWTTPYDVTLPNNQATLYTAARNTVAVLDDRLDGTNTRLGSAAGGLNYLVGERNCYVLWGYQGDPQDMTADGRSLFLNLLHFVGSWAQCADMGPVADAGHVAYVQLATQDTMGDRYRAFLEELGWSVDTFTPAQLAQSDLSVYDAIVVGGNTGSWSNTAARFAILKARRPVIGIHTGGYNLFGTLGLNIGSPNGTTTNALRTVQPLIITNPVWNQPFTVLPDADGKIRLYNTDPAAISVANNRLTIINTRLGVEGPNLGNNVIVGERHCFMLWGYDGDPWVMTLDGMHTFANLLRYLQDWQRCDDLDPPGATGSIAYIQSGVSDSFGDQFDQMLLEMGWTMTRFPLSQVPGADLSLFDIIVLGENTGQDGNWSGSLEARNVITRANRPILGLYQGGYSFFGTLGLDIGYPNGTTGGRLRTVVPVDLRHAVWRQPFFVPPATDGKVKLHNVDQLTVAIHNSQLSNQSVRVGAEGLYQDLNYIVGRRIGTQNCYVLWGYQGTPGTMTLDGLQLLINVLSFLRHSAACGGGEADDTAMLTVNHQRGAPGCFLTVKGWGFPPNQAGALMINGVPTATIQTNALGAFQYLLRFEANANPGKYNIVASVNPIGRVFFSLDPNGVDWTQEDEGTVFDVGVDVPSLAAAAYLPLLTR